MSGRPLPHQLLWEARQFCGEHHLFIVEVHDKVADALLTKYVIYREPLNGRPKQRLKKIGEITRLLKACRLCAGVDA